MQDNKRDFVQWFRAASPYIHAHRGRTFVISFGGEAVYDANFASFIHDIALLNSLGIRLVLVPGTQPQIEQCLNNQECQIRYIDGLRVTDEKSLMCVKEAAGVVRIEIEALLSMGLANSPMASAQIRVASGNFVTARPLGIHQGVDLRYSGTVRRIDTDAINARLSQGEIVLILPIGYSPTGEVFDLDEHEVASAVAESIRASKLVFLIEGNPLIDEDGDPIRQLTQKEAEPLLAKLKAAQQPLPELECAIRACRHGVSRTHIIDRHTDGAVLLELFSRDGIGTMVSAIPFDLMRKATIDDVGGILSLISPLEAAGILVRRSREKLEIEINHFTVLVRDGAIIGCAALFTYHEEKIAELACLAVDPNYRNNGWGEELLINQEREARQQGMRSLFVLTTHTAHWFLERGFREGRIEELPISRQKFYNYQRNSKVFVKELDISRRE